MHPYWTTCRYNGNAIIAILEYSDQNVFRVLLEVKVYPDLYVLRKIQVQLVIVDRKEIRVKLVFPDSLVLMVCQKFKEI